MQEEGVEGVGEDDSSQGLAEKMMEAIDGLGDKLNDAEEVEKLQDKIVGGLVERQFEKLAANNMTLDQLCRKLRPSGTKQTGNTQQNSSGNTGVTVDAPRKKKEKTKGGVERKQEETEDSRRGGGKPESKAAAARRRQVH